MYSGGIKLTSKERCPLTEVKIKTSKRLANDVVEMINNKNTKKMNAIWMEVTGCSGNIISFLNSENPGIYDILTDIVNFTFNNTLMGAEGDTDMLIGLLVIIQTVLDVHIHNFQMEWNFL
jgi:Ni,Fe-hydrogenase I small subunit